MNSNSDTYSLDMPRSITTETKEKFDTFLKAALENTSKNRKRDKPRQQNSDSGSHVTENLVAQESDKDLVPSEEDSKEFILNKFFCNSNVNNSDVTFIKPPVPKPRKNKFPSIVHSDQGTYKVTPPNSLNNGNSDSSSNKTYNVSSKKKFTSQKIGDILVHSTPVNRGNVQVLSQTLQSQSEESEDGSHIEIELDNNLTKSLEINIENLNSKVKNLDSADVLKEEEVYISSLNIIQIIIHKTDRLQLNSFVIHPVVKVHVTDISSGNYYPKHNKCRPVVFYYENDEVDYISPIMTQTYNLQEQRSLFPAWEELILLNEEYNYFLEESKNIIIFFEILDFVSVYYTSHQKEKGWHKIAFAFLKLSGRNNAINLNKRMRLQLYYPDSNTQNKDSRRCALWNIWKKKKMRKYPSTLHVTIKEVAPPTKTTTAVLRSKTPIQEETGYVRLHIDDESNTNLPSNNDLNHENFENLAIQRNNTLTKEVKVDTLLPNKCVATLYCGYEGCLTLQFSHDGLYLACSIRCEAAFAIVVYSVDSLQELCQLPCHQGLIYSINWSLDDKLIIAASADNTVSIWDFTKHMFLQILPHPSFVYTSDVSKDKIIASGCYDCAIRIWKNVGNEECKYQLCQELEGHENYITCVRFNKKSTLLYSADSGGAIKEWCFVSADWKHQRDISLPDLKGIVINQILLVGRDRRMVIHSRDSTLRILDMNTLVVLHWFQGGLNRSVQTACSISSCGQYIISGSENSLVNIWKTRNGKYIGSLIPYNKSKSFITIHAVQFHPQNNIIAVAHHGSDLPILIFSYDSNVKTCEIDLRIIHPEELQSVSSHHKMKVTKSPFTRKRAQRLDYKTVLNKLDKFIDDQTK